MEFLLHMGETECPFSKHASAPHVNLHLQASYTYSNALEDLHCFFLGAVSFDTPYCVIQ